MNRVNLTAIRERVTVDVIRRSPKGLYSAVIGWGARRTLPRPLRSPLYRTFARMVGARLDEAELDVTDYPTFGDFFARRLRPGVRQVHGAADTIIAPCDGVVAMRGRAEKGRMIQAKGRDYQLAELVMDDECAGVLDGGPYVTIYLSPRDYHRVHTPMTARLLGYDYLPGNFFPVNPLFSRSVDSIMSSNERVVFHLASKALGRVALVMVGALGVSNIAIAHDGAESRALRSEGVRSCVRFREPVTLERGDELGAFHLGSTVILIFEPDRIDLDTALGPDSALRFGERIARVRNPVELESSMGIVS